MMLRSQCWKERGNELGEVEREGCEGRMGLDEGLSKEAKIGEGMSLIGAGARLVKVEKGCFLE